jgi:hypothetical protein
MIISHHIRSKAPIAANMLSSDTTLPATDERAYRSSLRGGTAATVVEAFGRRRVLATS